MGPAPQFAYFSQRSRNEPEENLPRVGWGLGATSAGGNEATPGRTPSGGPGALLCKRWAVLCRLREWRCVLVPNLKKRVFSLVQFCASGQHLANFKMASRNQEPNIAGSISSS